jgi:lipid-A-disaccharide synthase
MIVRALGLMRIERYSLPNVLAGEALVPELIQERCTDERLASAVLDYFRHDEFRTALGPRFLAIHRQLRCGASQRAADAVAELIENGISARFATKVPR